MLLCWQLVTLVLRSPRWELQEEDAMPRGFGEAQPLEGLGGGGGETMPKPRQMCHVSFVPLVMPPLITVMVGGGGAEVNISGRLWDGGDPMALCGFYSRWAEF